MQNRSRSRSNSNDRDRNNEAPAEPSKRLFVSGITSGTTKEQLQALFSQCGSVIDLLLKPLENGGTLCFVEMATQGEADAAIADLNGKRVCGKMIWVKYARPRPQGNRREGGGGRQGDQDRGQPFGQRGGRGGFNQRPEGLKRFEGGRGNDRGNDRSNQRSNEGRSGERGRFGQQEGGSNRGGFRNFDKREEDRGTRMFGGSGFQQGGREQGARELGGREQGGSRALNVVEDMDY